MRSRGPLGIPPRLRRFPGVVPVTPGASAIREKIRETLRKAQRKLFASRARLLSGMAASRLKIDSRR